MTRLRLCDKNKVLYRTLEAWWDKAPVSSIVTKTSVELPDSLSQADLSSVVAVIFAMSLPATQYCLRIILVT